MHTFREMFTLKSFSYVNIKQHFFVIKSQFHGKMIITSRYLDSDRVDFLGYSCYVDLSLSLKK